MQTFWTDVRYGFRSMVQHPTILGVAILTLALGIGANTAIFSMVNALLIKPLPFPELNRLAAIWENVPSQGVERNETAIANYLDWKVQNQSFKDVGLYSWWNANLSGIDPPERVQGFLVTSNLLDILRVKPDLGRGFLPEEGQPGKDQVVILSNGLWQRRFAADKDVINKTVNVNGITRTIVGVMPEDYTFPKGAEVLAPFAFTPELAANRQSHSYLTIARLKDGVSFQQAQTDMDTVAARLEQQYPQTNTGRGVVIYALLTDTVREYRAALLVSSLAVGFVLLIACANIANLMLAQAARRTKEIALRLALGASRWRIIRQLLTESVLLSVFGGAFGVIVAIWGIDTLKAAMPSDVARFVIGYKNFGINLPVLAFTLGLSILVGILFGLAPALQASKTSLNETLKEGGKTTPGRQRLRNTLVMAEVALSIMLLIGAGLVMKSFWKLLKTDPGFNPQNVLTLSVTLPRAKYPDAAKRAAFYKDLVQRVESLPGVEAVGMVNYLPLGGSNSSDAFLVEGLPEPPPGEEFMGRYRTCTPDYFKAMGIPLLKGRRFTEQDRDEFQPVAIVNETMARQYWANGDAIGKRFRPTGPLEENPWREIVGIIKDVKFELYSPVTPEYYFATAQDPWGTMILTANTKVEPLTVAAAIRNEVTTIDKDQPIYDVKTMRQVYSESALLYSFSGGLLSVFAAIALLLAAVGIYGVMSYMVTQRTQEIGIRMALGAKRSDVLRIVIRQGMRLTAVGAAGGILGAYFFMQTMKGFLYEVLPNDSATYLIVPLFLSLISLIACYVPARRATKVDPMIALRYE